jgi:AraC family transcriptional regulator, transcriptional activator of pobA
MIESEEEKDILKEKKLPKVQNTTFKNFLKILEENFRRPEGTSLHQQFNL